MFLFNCNISLSAIISKTNIGKTPFNDVLDFKNDS